MAAHLAGLRAPALDSAGDFAALRGGQEALLTAEERAQQALLATEREKYTVEERRQRMKDMVPPGLGKVVF